MSLQDVGSSSALDLLAPIVRQLLETEDGARWWKDTAPHLYVEDFRRQVDASVARVAPPRLPGGN